MIRELYDGKILPGQFKNRHIAEQKEITTKINEAVSYLNGVLSPSDGERLQELDKLYATLSMSSERETFAHGFSLGVAVMVDVADEVKAMEYLQKVE